VTVNEVPGNEAAFGEAPSNQELGNQTASGENSGSRTAANETLTEQTEVNDADGVRAMAVAPPRSLAASAGRAALALFAAIVAWLVPGLGHLLLGRWGRALLFFVAVGGLAITGYILRGNVFPAHSGDPFGTLGFVADAGAGVFYYFSRFLEAAGPDVSRAAGDYGTRFIAAAGVVNVLAVLDVIEIATGRRS
jgi:Family of unknown function (DUF6677)